MLLFVAWLAGGGELSAAGGKPKPSEPVQTYTYKEVEAQPRFRKKIQFPLLALDYPAATAAVVAVVVGADGRVVHAELLTTNEPRFGSEAVKLSRLWRFTPARKDGAAVNCTTVVTLKATIKNTASAVHFTRAVWLLTPEGQVPVGEGVVLD